MFSRVNGCLQTQFKRFQHIISYGKVSPKQGAEVSSPDNQRRVNNSSALGNLFLMKFLPVGKLMTNNLQSVTECYNFNLIASKPNHCLTKFHCLFDLGPFVRTKALVRNKEKESGSHYTAMASC